jgi:3-oxoadipate enol-lactonase
VSADSTNPINELNEKLGATPGESDKGLQGEKKHDKFRTRKAPTEQRRRLTGSAPARYIRTVRRLVSGSRAVDEAPPVIRLNYEEPFAGTDSANPPRVSDFADRVVAAARAGGRHRFDLVGYFLGAAVANFIAAEYPEMVRSLVLVSGFGYGADPRMRLQFDLWLHLARTDKIALTKLLLVSGLSRDFLSAFDEPTVDGIVQSFVAMSDWPLIELNIRVDLAVDVREQARKIKAPTLSITRKYDQVVPPFYTQALADSIPAAKTAEIPSGHLSFLEKPVDLASAMLTFLLEKHA